MEEDTMKNTLKRLTVLTLILTLLLACMPIETASAADTATVRGGWLILREYPSTSAKALASYNTGTKVTLMGKSGNFYNVICPDGLTGYMMAKYLTVNGTGGLSDGCTAYVTASNNYNVNLRSGAGTGYPAIASYAKGTKVTVNSVGSTWCYITVGGSVSGFMMTKYLTVTEPASKVTTAWVTSGNGLSVVLRTGPGKGYGSINSYKVGTEVTVLTWGTTWSQIRISTAVGYMMTKFLTTTKPVIPTPTPGACTVTSENGLSVKLRSGPGTAYPVIRAYPVGTVLELITEGSVWDYIRIGTTFGYMMKKFVAKPY